MHPLLKSAALSLATLMPSLLICVYIVDNKIPMQYSSMAAYAILLWAVLDFVIVVFIEPYRRALGKMTIPSFIGAISIVLLFIIMVGLNRFVDHLGYGMLTPFVAAAVLLLSAAVFMEKNIALKSYLSLSVIMLALIWAMGAADKVVMPF